MSKKSCKTKTKGLMQILKGNTQKATSVNCKSKKILKPATKWYGYERATKVPSPLFKRAGKTKNFAKRPSARALYDEGFRGQVYYGGKTHIMAFKKNGSPYWKVV